MPAVNDETTKMNNETALFKSDLRAVELIVCHVDNVDLPKGRKLDIRKTIIAERSFTGIRERAIILFLPSTPSTLRR